jgi:bifunctional non-homologous end joining protein LigD
MPVSKQEDALGAYTRKRNFGNTPEPLKNDRVSRTGPNRQFVIQRHHASTLHFDFRLEVDGVLKSWAVPKGPPQAAGIRRLAIKVEDHPLSYAKFEGTIPEGNYGAGKVKIWDHGWYLPEVQGASDKDINSQIRKGSLKFILQGRKLKGKFVLTKFTKGERDQWLLIKRKEDGSDTK